jgi:hypothetical protein
MKKIYPWIPLIGIILVFRSYFNGTLPKELGWPDTRLGHVNLVCSSIIQGLCVTTLVFLLMLLRIH